MRKLFLLLALLCCSVVAQAASAPIVLNSYGNGMDSVTLIVRFHLSGSNGALQGNGNLWTYTGQGNSNYTGLSEGSSATLISGITAMQFTDGQKLGFTSGTGSMMVSGVMKNIVWTCIPYTISKVSVSGTGNPEAITIYQDVYAAVGSTVPAFVSGSTRFLNSGTHTLSVYDNGAYMGGGTAITPAGYVSNWNFQSTVGDNVTVTVDGVTLSNTVIGAPSVSIYDIAATAGAVTISESNGQTVVIGGNPVPTPTPTPTPAPGASPTPPPDGSDISLSVPQKTLANYNGASGPGTASLTRGDLSEGFGAALDNRGLTSEGIYDSVLKANLKANSMSGGGSASSGSSTDIYGPVKRALDDKDAERSGSAAIASASVRDGLNSISTQASLMSGSFSAALSAYGTAPGGDTGDSGVSQGTQQFVITLPMMGTNYYASLNIDDYPSLVACLTWVRNCVILMGSFFFVAWCYQKIWESILCFSPAGQHSAFSPLGEPLAIGESSTLSGIRLAIILVISVSVAAFVGTLPTMLSGWWSWTGTVATTGSGLQAALGNGAPAYAWHWLTHLLPIPFVCTLLINWAWVCRAQTFLCCIAVAVIKAIPGA